MGMPLEHQVCSFRSARELDSLGVGRPGLYSYNQAGGLLAREFVAAGEGGCFAYTVSEMFDALPGVIEVDEIKYVLFISKIQGEPHVRYQHSAPGETTKIIKKSGETLAESMAEMWIHLIQQGIIPDSRPGS